MSACDWCGVSMWLTWCQHSVRLLGVWACDWGDVSVWLTGCQRVTDTVSGCWSVTMWLAWCQHVTDVVSACDWRGVSVWMACGQRVTDTVSARECQQVTDVLSACEWRAVCVQTCRSEWTPSKKRTWSWSQRTRFSASTLRTWCVRAACSSRRHPAPTRSRSSCSNSTTPLSSSSATHVCANQVLFTNELVMSAVGLCLCYYVIIITYM